MTTFSHPVKGLESEYNLWYDQVHFHDLLKVPEINSAQRFRPLTNPGLPENPFLAIYEIETSNIHEVMQAIQNGIYIMQPSDAIDPSSVNLQVYEVIGEKQFS